MLEEWELELFAACPEDEPFLPEDETGAKCDEVLADDPWLRAEATASGLGRLRLGITPLNPEVCQLPP